MFLCAMDQDFGVSRKRSRNASACTISAGKGLCEFHLLARDRVVEGELVRVQRLRGEEGQQLGGEGMMDGLHRSR